MPLETILKDHPDFVLPPEKLGEKVAQMVAIKEVNAAGKKNYRVRL
jgi:hypothetical protein